MKWERKNAQWIFFFCLQLSVKEEHSRPLSLHFAIKSVVIILISYWDKHSINKQKLEVTFLISLHVYTLSSLLSVPRFRPSLARLSTAPSLWTRVDWPQIAAHTQWILWKAKKRGKTDSQEKDNGRSPPFGSPFHPWSSTRDTIVRTQSDTGKAWEDASLLINCW